MAAINFFVKPPLAMSDLLTKGYSIVLCSSPSMKPGTNNFTTTNRDELKPLLFPSQSPTDTQVENLINFIRGVDVYDQDADNNKTESIHKLADIYHSNLIVVGPPEGSTTSSNSLNFDKTDSVLKLPSFDIITLLKFH